MEGELGAGEEEAAGEYGNGGDVERRRRPEDPRQPPFHRRRFGDSNVGWDRTKGTRDLCRGIGRSSVGQECDGESRGKK